MKWNKFKIAFAAGLALQPIAYITQNIVVILVSFILIVYSIISILPSSIEEGVKR